MADTVGTPEAAVARDAFYITPKILKIHNVLICIL
jgi:hypothetical protein